MFKSNLEGMAWRDAMKKDVKKLTEDLKDKDWNVREKAVDALAKMGKLAVESRIPALNARAHSTVSYAVGRLSFLAFLAHDLLQSLFRNFLNIEILVFQGLGEGFNRSCIPLLSKSPYRCTSNPPIYVL